MDSNDEFIEFDSYLVPESDLDFGALRMLEVDNRVILPELTHVRFVITSGDVIHSFAVPSLGIKCDAMPGRLNQVSVYVNRCGVYYGQCSEICLRPDRDIDYGNEIIPLIFPTSCPTVKYDVTTLELGLRYLQKQKHIVIRHLNTSPVCSDRQARPLSHRNLIRDKVNNVKLKLIEGSLTSYWYYGGLPQNQKSLPTR